MKKVFTILGIFLVPLYIIVMFSCSKNENPQNDDNYGTVTDIDGNTYKTLKFGDDIWMVENLKVSKTNTGTPLTFLTIQDNKWCPLTRGYGYYADDQNNGQKYGYFYKYLSLENIAPKGWHVATSEEWYRLGNDRFTQKFCSIFGGVRWKCSKDLLADHELDEQVYYWASNLSFGSTEPIVFGIGTKYRDVTNLNNYWGAHVRCVKDK
jgi:hypothetical protein